MSQYLLLSAHPILYQLILISMNVQNISNFFYFKVYLHHLPMCSKYSLNIKHIKFSAVFLPLNTCPLKIYDALFLVLKYNILFM